VKLHVNILKELWIPTFAVKIMLVHFWHGCMLVYVSHSKSFTKRAKGWKE